MVTAIGEHRARYSERVEQAPSRFANGGADYRAWAARADRALACCVSNIGPRCGHAIGGQGVTLERIARESVEIAPDPVSGRRANDPLRALVTDETWTEHIYYAGLVVGQTIAIDRGVNMAARVRSELRRYVVKSGA